MDLFLVFLILLFAVLEKCASNDWSYSGEFGQASWPTKFAPACNGTKQSPVDINTLEMKISSIPPFVLNNYEKPLQLANITNNGHTVQLNLISTEPPVTISDGGLPDIYVFQQLHFHWGSNDKQGSEHTINLKKYPLELHLVHYGKNWTRIDQAVDKPNGLAVLGILFEICEKDNPKLDTLLGYLNKVPVKDKNVHADNSIILELMLPKSRKLYYRYNGSLTTPACFESVIWSVFDEKVKISKSQLSKFRDLKDENEKKLEDNYRYIQPLNGRKIYSSCKPDKNSGPNAYSISKLMVVILINLLITQLSS